MNLIPLVHPSLSFKRIDKYSSKVVSIPIVLSLTLSCFIIVYMQDVYVSILLVITIIIINLSSNEFSNSLIQMVQAIRFEYIVIYLKYKIGK